jgi:hypothetical protein
MYTVAVGHEVAIDGTLICCYGTVACPYSNLHVLLFLHVQYGAKKPKKKVIRL